MKALFYPTFHQTAARGIAQRADPRVGPRHRPAAKRKEVKEMAKKETAPYKIYLTENELPTSWYNLRADMKTKPAPLLHPGTLQPLKFEDMQPIFCDELIKQELDNDTQFIPIPGQVMDF